MGRTAEDLVGVSRRLARYEALLNDIIPHVSPDIRARIDEVREQVCYRRLILWLALLTIGLGCCGFKFGGFGNERNA